MSKNIELEIPNSADHGVVLFLRYGAPEGGFKSVCYTVNRPTNDRGLDKGLAVLTLRLLADLIENPED